MAQLRREIGQRAVIVERLGPLARIGMRDISITGGEGEHGEPVIPQDLTHLGRVLRHIAEQLHPVQTRTLEPRGCGGEGFTAEDPCAAADLQDAAPTICAVIATVRPSRCEILAASASASALTPSCTVAGISVPEVSASRKPAHSVS